MYFHELSGTKKEGERKQEFYFVCFEYPRNIPFKTPKIIVTDEQMNVEM